MEDDTVIGHRLEGDRGHPLARGDEANRHDRKGAPARQAPEDRGGELGGVLPHEQADARQDRDGADHPEDEPPAAPGSRRRKGAGASGRVRCAR